MIRGESWNFDDGRVIADFGIGELLIGLATAGD